MPFGLGFTPHVQRKAHTDLRLRAHAIDVALHHAIAPVAPFHRMRRGGQQRIIQKREGFFSRGGTELLQRVTEEGKPLDAPPPLGPLGEGCLGPTAPSEQRVPLFHDRTQRTSLGQPTADTPQGLPFGCVQVTLDEQRPLGAQSGAVRCQPRLRAGRRLGRWRARGPCAPWGLLGCQVLACAGPGPADRFVHLGHEMQRTDVLRDIPAPLHEGGGSARRAIGRDAEEGQGAYRQGRVHTPQERPDVVVGGLVIQDGSEEALVAAMLNRGKQTAGSIRPCIGGHIARKIRQRPGQEVRVHARLRLFFPQPRPRCPRVGR